MPAYSTITTYMVDPPRRSVNRQEHPSDIRGYDRRVRWLGKALLQKGMSVLPRSESANYLFQRHVTHALPPSLTSFRGKFSRAVAHLDALAGYGPARPLGDAVLYEFGAGWDLAVQLSYWSLGVDRQVIVDLQPHVRLELVNLTLGRLESERATLAAEAKRELRDPGREGVESVWDLEKRFGITYLAPRDARATGLDSGSVDLVSSTNTLEHVPAADLVPILAECRRLLRPDGILSSRIDLRDHYSYFDRGLSPYNFLRYSDRAWRLFNSSVLYQNRLRRPDYLHAFSESGFEIVSEGVARPNEGERAALDSLELAPRFREYSPDDVGVLALVLVARPAPAPSPDRAQ
jgi:SAM-dependent methyltransferase